MVIAVDFDGTLVNGEEPLPGAKEAMQALRDADHVIIIHSCNNEDWIRRVLNNADIPYDYIWTKPGKPIAHAYVDDRSVEFNNNWEEIVKRLNG